MVVQLDRVARWPLPVRGRFDLGRLAARCDVEEVEPVEADLEVRPAGSDRFRVTGRFATRARAVCARCLEPVQVALGGPVALVYVPESTGGREVVGESEMRPQDVAVCTVRDHRLEVLPMLEEQVNLALPMRFLCSESCQGLCPRCGSNRNLKACGCSTASTDPRLEALRALR